MPSLQKLAVLSAAALITLGASAATPPKAEDHAVHHSAASASAPTSDMDGPMKSMRDMRDKMMNAKTPEERQALMADHMKAMQDGMQTMKGMGSMSGMGMGSMGGKSSGKSMPPDRAKRRQTMEQRMDMMQMMMEMMMQRAPDPAAPAGK